MFASYTCQYCSSSYLFPLAIAGIVLVLVLFILNHTVTDGTINAFITGINGSVLFHKFTVANMLMSLANLDLGTSTMAWMTMLKCGYY